MKKVAISKEEQGLSYAKYFNQELATIPEDKIAIGQGPQADCMKALKIQDKNKFLSGEDKGVEIGFCVMEDGTGFVANATFMPGVTVEMLDWWFPWHSVGSDLRYKLWDNEDHYYARADKADYVLDPNVPMNQKTWGVNHQILEDIGFGPEPLNLCFKCPKDLGYDMDLVGKAPCESMVCAVGEGNTPAVMSHKWYTVEGGVMFESRFWMGFGLKDGQLVKLVPDGISIPDFVPRALFNHNIKEYSNLAAVLPKIYAEEKENF